MNKWFIVAIFSLSMWAGQTMDKRSPKNLCEAVAQMSTILTEEQKNQFKGMKEEDAPKMDDSVGRLIQYNWGTWCGKNPKLLRSFSTQGISPEDTNGLFLWVFWMELNGRPWKLDEAIQLYKKRYPMPPPPPPIKP